MLINWIIATRSPGQRERTWQRPSTGNHSPPKPPVRGPAVSVWGRAGGDKAGMTPDVYVSCWGKCRPITRGKYWLYYPCLCTPTPSPSATMFVSTKVLFGPFNHIAQNLFIISVYIQAEFHRLKFFTTSLWSAAVALWAQCTSLTSIII